MMSMDVADGRVDVESLGWTTSTYLAPKQFTVEGH